MLDDVGGTCRWGAQRCRDGGQQQFARWGDRVGRSQRSKGRGNRTPT
ncbi:hypothetical protein [uncultured Bacteroides sp.]|nr:hypothetical protein [uncultured Bacteroides sp.]